MHLFSCVWVTFLRSINFQGTKMQITNKLKFRLIYHRLIMFNNPRSSIAKSLTYILKQRFDFVIINSKSLFCFMKRDFNVPTGQTRHWNFFYVVYNTPRTQKKERRTLVWYFPISENSHPDFSLGIVRLMIFRPITQTVALFPKLAQGKKGKKENEREPLTRTC